MFAGVAGNLVTLAYFKYFYFLESTFTLLTKPWLGHFDKIQIEIILPLGISFFVFEFIHYLVDVYRGSEPVTDFMAFALFPSFFPTQIAGPIKRFQDFVPQLKVPTKFSRVEFDEGVFLILTGLFKKVLLADNLALYVSTSFATPDKFSGLDLWMASAAFAFQVYFDFGGYADIARGSAKLFGYKVPINFDFPYLSGNISEMWRRWHITLSTWLRDYLFIPLGGSRHGRLQTARNLIITMTLGGFWHGAGFQFILWGLYHGVLLSLHREFRLFREAHPKLFGFLDTRLGHVFSIALTFISSILGLAIFCSQDAPTACLVLRKMLLFDGFAQVVSGTTKLASVNYPLIFPSIFVLLPVFMLAQAFISRIGKVVPFQQSPRFMKIAYGTALMFLLFAFAPDNSPRFIYFQF